MNDTCNFRGDLEIILRDTVTNEIKLHTLEKNLVVTTGKQLIASRLAGNTSAVIGWMSVGTSGTAAQVTDTTLLSEIARVSTSVSGGTPSGNTVLYTATFPAGVGTGALQEAGLFNQNSAGTMLARTVYSVINKGAADEMIVNWTITAG